eukprot:PRCOL_00001652-RA
MAPASVAVKRPRDDGRGTAIADTSALFEVPALGSARATTDFKHVESDQHRLSQRQKRIDMGKNTLGYVNYIRAVPKHKRRRSDPQTPDIHMIASKRQFDGIVKAWRRRLHDWDPKGDGKDGRASKEDAERAMEMEAQQSERAPEPAPQPEPSDAPRREAFNEAAIYGSAWEFD